MNKSRKNPNRRLGFTLIEILVVVSILGILTALLIPRLRTVSKERNIRESARVVGSMFAQASQRAVADGVAGVLLEREDNNDNFLLDSDGDGVLDYEYGVTRLSLLRRVPDYVGDQLPTEDRSVFGYGATTDSMTAGAGTAATARISKPIEQDDQKIVEVGDFISFNHNSVKYRILAVTEAVSNGVPFLDLTLHLGENELGLNEYLPDPAGFLPEQDFDGSATPAGFEPGAPFVIQRSPRTLRSSTVDLPNGYIIDLRFSGFTMLDSGFQAVADIPRAQQITNVIEPRPRVLVTRIDSSPQVVSFSQSNIAFLFDDQGKLDRMISRAPYDFNLDGINDTFATFQRIAGDSLHLFVTEIETDPTTNPLYLDKNLWVTISSGSGTANVGYNFATTDDPTLVAPVAPGASSMERLSGLFNSDDLSSGWRVRFNTIISQARNDAKLGTASQ